MMFRLTKVTEYNYCLEIGEDTCFQTVFLSKEELDLASEVLKASDSLDVAESVFKWYTV